MASESVTGVGEEFVGCSWSVIDSNKLSLVGLVEAGEALLHEGFLGGGEASSCCVRGTNTTMRKGLVLFRMEGWTQEPTWALVGWLNSAFTISPTPSMNDVLRAGGQC